MKAYIVRFTLINDRGSVLKEGGMRVKNCLSPMHAREKLRKHLDDLFWDAHKLVFHATDEVSEPKKTDWSKLGIDPNLFNELFGKK